MKKTIGLFLLAVAVCVISIAAYTERVYQPREGFRAPAFEMPAVADTTRTLRLADLKGRYVLLSFWSAADPQSRMRNMTYDAVTRDIDRSLNHRADSIVFLSVNFDASHKLVRELAARDSLSVDHLGQIGGQAAQRLITDYRLADGYRAYLIDPSGRAIARNPSADTMRDILTASR